MKNWTPLEQSGKRARLRTQLDLALALSESLTSVQLQRIYNRLYSSTCARDWGTLNAMNPGKYAAMRATLGALQIATRYEGRIA